MHVDAAAAGAHVAGRLLHLIADRRRRVDRFGDRSERIPAHGVLCPRASVMRRMAGRVKSVPALQQEAPETAPPRQVPSPAGAALGNRRESWDWVSVAEQ